MSDSSRPFVPPDGGYGWVVVFACVVINSCLLPLTQNVGLIYQSKFTEMNISAAEISFLLHLSNSMSCMLGLFSGPLLKKFNYRQVAFAGSSLMCLGVFLTAFAQSYGVLIFTIGILIGTGQGILLPATYLVVNTYFKKKLTVAVSLQITGAGISPIIFPHLIIFLLDHFDTKEIVLILGGISLIALPTVILLKPARKVPEKPADKRDATSIPNNDLEANTDLLERPVYAETTTPKKKLSTFHEVLKTFNFKLLLDKGYVLIILGMGVSFAAELNIVLMMQFILSEFKYSEADVGLATSIQAASDVLGRLLVPFLAHKIGWSAKLMYGCSLLGSSIGRTILAIFWDKRDVVLTSTVILGLSKGAKAVFQSLIIPKYVAFEDLPAATGLNMLATGVLSLIIGPFIGFIHDATNSYSSTLHTASVLSLLCVALWFFDNLLFSKKPKVEEDLQEKTEIQ